MADAATSYIYLSNGRILLIGENLENDEHQHYALQVTINLSDSTYVMRQNGQDFSVYGAVIRSNSPHQVVSSDTWRAVILLDAQTQHAVQIARRFHSDTGIAVLSEEDVAYCRDCLRDFAGKALPIERAALAIDRVVERLAGPVWRPELRNPHVAKSLNLIHRSRGKDLSLSFLAGQIHVSESHLSHIFKSEVGIPLQRYLLWYKVAQAGFLIGRGMPLTEAAEAAGFSDSPHFSRTFRSMFGITPSQVLKRSRFVQVISDSTC